MSPAVTVIVPVHNAEPFIKEAADSVAAQSLADIQVVFIDDGSTDGSRELLDGLAASDSRVEIYSCGANRGAGFARNLGLRHARGEFVRFVDADDLVPYDSTRLMYELALSTKSPLVRGNGVVFRGRDRGHTVPMRYVNWAGYATGLRYSRHNFHGVPFYHPLFLFHRGFLLEHGINFPHSRCSEDPVFLLEALLRAATAATIPDVVYEYRSHKVEEDRFRAAREYSDHIAHYLELHRMWRDEGLMGEWLAYFDQTFWWFWNRYIKTNREVLLREHELLKSLLAILPETYDYPQQDFTPDLLKAVTAMQAKELEIFLDRYL